MVGLSIVLEAQKSSYSSSSNNNRKKIINHQVINKTNMINKTNKKCSSSISSSSSCSAFSLYNNRPFLPPTFLDQCFLCQQKLLPGKDIYMYRGDRAFCSVECRCRQIFMDEEESIPKGNCSLTAIKPASSSSPSSSCSSSSSSSSSDHRKGTRNRAGGFAC